MNEGATIRFYADRAAWTVVLQIADAKYVLLPRVALALRDGLRMALDQLDESQTSTKD